MKTRIACGVLVAALWLLPGAQTHGATAATHSRPVVVAHVTIKNLAFQPVTLTVTAGTTVIWTNMDPFTHTVTSDNGLFNSGNIGPGKTYKHTFAKAGTFPYDCHIHPFMEATVKVK